MSLTTMSRPAAGFSTRAAGAGAVAFGVLTFAQIIGANSPGGSYDESQVTSFLATGHRTLVIALFHVTLLGVLGLLVLSTHLRDDLRRRGQDARATLVQGLTSAAAAAFALGASVDAGLALSHTEGGSQVVVSPQVTYTLSQIGVTFVFGAGAVLLGLALLTYARAAWSGLPSGRRTLFVLTGVCGVAGLAFFTFFLQLLLLVVLGIALMTRGDEPAES